MKAGKVIFWFGFFIIAPWIGIMMAAVLYVAASMLGIIKGE